MNDLDKSKIEPNLTGVKGWLLLFCAGRAILSPILSLYLLGTSYLEIQDFIDNPQVLNFFVISSIVVFAEIGYGIFVAIKLWRIKENAVKITRIYLIVSSCLVLFSEFIPLLVGFPVEFVSETFREGLLNLLRTIGLNVAWYVYFGRSKRVANTYSS